MFTKAEQSYKIKMLVVALLCGTSNMFSGLNGGTGSF